MDKSKQKALKTAFRIILKRLFNKLIGDLKYDNQEVINITTEELLKEVTIRTKVA